MSPTPEPPEDAVPDPPAPPSDELATEPTDDDGAEADDHAPPAHLVVAAATLCAFAVLVVALLLAFPSLRASRDSSEGAAPGTGASEEVGEDLPLHDEELETLAPLIAALQEQWRHGRTDADFFTALARSTTASPGLAAAEDLDLLASWSQGGLALARGDRQQARHHLAEVVSGPAFERWLPLLPARFAGQPGADAASLVEWRVDLFWGDPLGEARQRLEQRQGEIGERRVLSLALAVVDHLDGHPEIAAASAAALADQFEGSPSYALVARFVGDEMLWSGDVGEAISWYNRLADVASPPQIAAVLRTLNLEGGRPLLQLACDEGFDPACRVVSSAASGSTRDGERP